ncbi:TonB-dependent receptor [Alteraurantiacibacter aestuarii]|nr:TonB-dependent receptor [Alteraurantiacibacter aestuarii]
MKIRNAGTAGYTRMFLCGVAAVALTAPVAVQAQDQDAAQQEAEDADASTGNSIIVTATKRETTLQETPVAVSVTTAETLERGQIRDLRDLQSVVPSLQVGQRQSVANTNFFIRGFGNGANNAGIEPSVGVFVDGVYRSRTAAQITDLPNVSRIEVLRGPQSTLFGKNASAGVISITTQEPQFDLEAMGEFTYGNRDMVIARGFVTGPLSDTVAASISGGINQRDGYLQDLGTGDKTNNRDRWFVRSQLLFDNHDNFSARFIADYDSIDENCCGVVNVRSSPATGAILALGGKVTDPADPFAGVVYNNFNSTNDIENYGFSGQLDYDFGGFTLTSITAYRNTNAVTAQDSDFSSANLIYPNAQDLTIDTFTQEVRLAGELTDGIDMLVGVFYLAEDVDQTNDLLFANQFRPYANLLIQAGTGGVFDVPTLEATFSFFDGVNYAGQFFADGQGFDEAYTLKSDAVSIFGQFDFEIADGLVLTLGGNYTDDSKTFTANAISSDVFSSIDLDAPQYAAFRNQVLYEGGVAQTVGDALGLDRLATEAEIFAFATDPDTAAFFPTIQAGAQAYADANMNNPLANPLAPLRALQFLPPFLAVPNQVESGKVGDDNFSYTARLAYDLSPDVNVYASYATGFKASSINLSRDSRPFLADRAAILNADLGVNNLTYGSRYAAPEKSRVIEAGIKANLDDLSVNLTVFDQVIKGFQSNIFTGTGFALLNAGKQSTFGIELDGVATFGDLTINFGGTYLDPVYDDFQNSSVGNLTGTRPADVPEFTVLLGAQYEFDIGHAVIVPRVSYLWQSREQLIEGLPGFLVRGPDGAILDNTAALAVAVPFTREVNDLTASIAYECECGVSLSVWSRNLLNKQDLGVIFDSPAQPGAVSAYPSDPRSYGATVRFRY